MKKMLLAVLTVLLLWGMTAFAHGEQGLPDMNAGLPDLRDALPLIVAELPDPGENLGIAGEAFQNGYSYNGMLYDLYRYPRPDPAGTFIDAYTAACEDAGWSVSKGKEAGNDALHLNDGESTAILLYDYQGYMLLMVPNRAAFTLHADIQPAPEQAEIKPDMLCFDYKGRRYEGTVLSCSLSEYINPYSSYNPSMFAFFGGFDKFSAFNTINLSIPVSMQAGDSFTVTAADELIPVVGLDFGDVLSGGMIHPSLLPLCGRNDYFTITIRTAEHTEKGYLVEGTFDCDLASENPGRRQKFENGTFSFCVKDW